MLNSIPGKDFDAPVIHPDGNADDQRSLRKFQSFTEVGIQPHQFCSLIELRYCESESRRIEFVQ